MSDAFGDLFAAAIDARCLTRASFAKAVGCPVSLVTEVARGNRRPPLARLETWATHLFDSAVDRNNFIRRGALLHAPPAVQAWVAELVANTPSRRPKPASGRRRQ